MSDDKYGPVARDPVAEARAIGEDLKASMLQSALRISSLEAQVREGAEREARLREALESCESPHWCPSCDAKLGPQAHKPECLLRAALSSSPPIPDPRDGQIAAANALAQASESGYLAGWNEAVERCAQVLSADCTDTAFAEANWIRKLKRGATESATKEPSPDANEAPPKAPKP